MDELKRVPKRAEKSSSLSLSRGVGSSLSFEKADSFCSLSISIDQRVFFSLCL